MSKEDGARLTNMSLAGQQNLVGDDLADFLVSLLHGGHARPGRLLLPTTAKVLPTSFSPRSQFST